MHSGPEVAPVFGMMLIMFMILMGLFMTIITAIIYCMIFSKAGYCWALGLLMFVPIANLIMLFILAFGDWPVQKELRMLKQQLQKT